MADACLKCHRPITREPGDGLRALCKACRDAASAAPAMSARERAKEAGAKTYEGQACKYCGGTVRFTCNYDCALCNKGRPRAAARERGVTTEARAQAYQAGDVTFIGAPCKVCGCVERYTGNWSCVQCQRSRRTVKETTSRQPPSDRERERQAMRARLAVVRAAQSARQRRAMGLPG